MLGAIFGLGAKAVLGAANLGVGATIAATKGAAKFAKATMYPPTKFLAKDAARTVSRAGMFAAENPKTALALGGLAAGGIGAAYYSGNDFSPSMHPFIGGGASVSTSYTPAASQIATNEMTGGTGMIGTGQVVGSRMLGNNAKAFMASTVGLTQGLHRSRHGR